MRLPRQVNEKLTNLTTFAFELALGLLLLGQNGGPVFVGNGNVVVWSGRPNRRWAEEFLLDGGYGPGHELLWGLVGGYNPRDGTSFVTFLVVHVVLTAFASL